jgi:hypothetical protein
MSLKSKSSLQTRQVSTFKLLMQQDDGGMEMGRGWK